MRITTFHYSLKVWVKDLTSELWHSRQRNDTDKIIARTSVADRCMIPYEDTSWDNKANCIRAIRP